MQRQAALDRIMAEMHDLVVQPHASPSNPEDAASPTHEGHKRSTALLENLKFADGPSGGVSLLPQRKRSTLGIIADSRGRATNDDDDDDDVEARGGESGEDPSEDAAHATAAAAFVVPPRRKWKCHEVDADLEPQFVWQQSATARFAADLPRRLDQTPCLKKDGSPRLSDASSPASGPARAPYGAWYIPQHHWWPLRQLEQQAADDVSGRESVPPPPSHDHCHRGSSPAQRQHKPPLPPSSPPRSGASPRGRSSRHPSVISPLSPSSPPSSPSAPPSALAGAAGVELQLASSYIGREYRNYIVATGSPLPHYLK